MKYQIQDCNKGFIALMSAIIISAILIIVSAIVGLQGFYGRWNVLDAEEKEESLAVAEGCADMVILELKNDVSYSGNTNFDLYGCVCTVGNIDNQGWKESFSVQSSCQDFYSDLNISVYTSNQSVISWEEDV